MNRKVLGIIAAAVALTLPWIGSSVLGAAHGYSTLATVAISGVGVLGASFLLTWGAETAEKDVPRAFAIAVLAILAVAPEYAVDALYAWNAGQFAGTPRGMEAGNLAVANMTGANRILIGLGWSGIALFTIFRSGADDDPAVSRREGFLADTISLDKDIGLEIVFLLAATAWAFLVPLGGGIDIFDTLFLVSLYVAYIVIILRGEPEEADEHVGVPAALQRLPKPRRIASVLLLFLYSGLVIFTAVEPFAHGLEELGQQVGIPPFFMIQWIAPLASESPELIAVAVLVNKARSTAGFNALISSKLNQWTLLIGTLAIVYSIAYGQYGVLSFDGKQAAEIWITAAQSLFAVALIVNLELSIREAVALFLLFISQVVLEFLILQEYIAIGVSTHDLLIGFAAVYVLLSAGLFITRRDALTQQLGSAVTTAREAIAGDTDEAH